MIAKITKGRRASSALRYDFGPGRREEHVDPRLVAGNVVGTSSQVADMIDRHTAYRQGLSRPIWRCALRTAPEDRIMDDAEWGKIAEHYVQAMGYGRCPWVAVRHGEDHIHLTISRLGWDGTLVPDGFDFRKSRPIVRGIERRHRLVNAELRSDRIAPQITMQERTASERRGSTHPEREQVRYLVRVARDTAGAGGRPAFEQALGKAGVLWRAHITPAGEMRGYSFSVTGWLDAVGTQIWVAASKVAKDLSWNELRGALDGEPARPETAEHS
ncbi:relaxase/mobilization nuclease domain-containing protein [Kitasatospora sp. NPDC059577]|uniref:relaxase/mobilization nuclease domain-containing protein n=1 Tax=Kitasatospora sp. NPDC059577 TaxID=3346873 RepID=UPI0036932428